jgi:superfamily II DNA or RNA helicase
MKNSYTDCRGLPSIFLRNLLDSSSFKHGFQMIQYSIDPKASHDQGAFVVKTSALAANFKPFLLEKGILKIPYPKSFGAIKLMASEGSLFLAEKKVVVDLFSEQDVYFYLSQADEETYELELRYLRGEKEFLLSDCAFVSPGPPSWFIQGPLLKRFHSDLDPVLLKRLLKGPYLIKADSLTDFLEDHDEIKAVFANKNKIQARSPFPILALSDKQGAFANLMLDYGDGHCFRMHFTEGKESCPRSSEEETLWEEDLLASDFLRKKIGKTDYYCPIDKVFKALSHLLESGWRIQDFQGKELRIQGSLSFAAESWKNALLLRGKMNYGDSEVSVNDLVGAFNRKERFIHLSDNSIGLVPETGAITKLAGIAEEGEIVSEGISLNKNRVGSLKDFWDEGMESSLDLEKIFERLEDFSGIQLSPPGSKFRGELRPYQAEGVNWLSFLYDYGFHGLLADDMGLGKTVQVLAFLSRINLEKPVLIVAPTSLLFNWKREIEKFLSDTNVQIYHGLDRSLDKQPQILITSYALLRRDFAVLSEISYQVIVLDEAQMIKNAQSQTAQAAFKLQADFRLSLSGTPIENRLEELWSQFHFLMPDLLGNYKDFSRDALASTIDSRYLERIKKKLGPFLYRRTKGEVAADLPEKIEQTVWLEMDEAQQAIYDTFLQSAKTNLLKKVSTDGVGKHRMEIFEQLLRLRQICCHPLLFNPEGGNSVKLDTLLRDLETVVDEGKKVLVYSQFTSMLALIAKAVKEKGWKYQLLEGKTKNREELVTNFQEDPEQQIFLISLKAGGVGLNLTAADYVFLYDPWWNEAAESQAIDRAHRIGRKDTVIAKRYLLTESIEEKMMNLKQRKQSIAEGVLAGEPSSLAITADDLYDLLS